MNDLRTKFNFVGKTQNNLSAELKAFEMYKRTLSTSQKKSLNFNRKYDLKDLRDIIDTNLDGIYIDPTNPDYKVAEIVKLRTIERQRLLKAGLAKTEEKLAQMDKDIKILIY